MAQNPIAANLAMAILFFGGFWTILTIQKEVFPRSVLDVVEVSVGYPGAAPAEVEQGILRPVEEAVRGIEGVREITSVAREGRGSVTIELVGGAERMQAFQDIDQAIGRVRTFPEDIEEPEVRLRSRQTEVISIGLFGPVDPWTLRQLAERLRDGLLAEPEITQVELSRARSYVTHVEIPKAVLREYGLTLPDVADLIASSSNDVAAGAVRTSGGELLLRVAARKQWADQFARIEVVADETGAIVTLGDIATIRDGFEETGFPSRFNDQPAVEVDVFRVGGQSPLTIADAVERRMRLFEAELPPGVELRTDNNNAEDFRRRLELVTENGLLAVVIVLAVLSLFLELRMAFWVMMGMSVSFIGGLLFLPSAGVSINMISLFGFLIALGIVVDDAVVVGENVYEHRARGASPLEAAVHGAREMALPVTFSVLTSIVAFIPLMLIPGEVGQFWKPLPIVVVVVLAVSLLEALFILPAHLAHVRMRRDTDGPLGRPRRVKRALGDLFSRLVERGFRPLLRISLRYRYVTIAACVSVLVIVGSFSMSAHMGMIPMPEVSADEIEAGVRLPVGTTPEQAAAVAQLVTDATLRMFEEHNLAAVAEGVKTNVRGQSFVDVELVMRPPDEREMSAREVIALWRDSIGDLPGVDQVSFEAERGPGGYRQDISIDISHNDIDVLERVTADLVAAAESFAATRDVSDSYNRGKQQLNFHLRPEGRALGLTSEDVGEQVRGAFFGSLALRLLRGTNEVEVRVKLPQSERSTMRSVDEMIVRTPDGTEVPLLDIADLSTGESFSSITRRDGRRVVNVSMDVEPQRAVGQVIDAINRDILPELAGNYPGLTWSFEGSDADLREATSSLAGSMGLALVVIYGLLAVVFRHYVQPLIVLAIIPFGIVGAVAGHILLGYDLSLISLMGVIALSGVLVNDSLIMIDYANRHRDTKSAFDAILDAGVRRFRPIFLTTATTALGLCPIIFEQSLQAQYIIPMAISLGFGIVVATAMILVLVPSFYLVLEDAEQILGRANVRA